MPDSTLEADLRPKVLTLDFADFVRPLLEGLPRNLTIKEMRSASYHRLFPPHGTEPWLRVQKRIDLKYRREHRIQLSETIFVAARYVRPTDSQSLTMPELFAALAATDLSRVEDRHGIGPARQRFLEYLANPKAKVLAKAA